jgi:hypothetical protein
VPETTYAPDVAQVAVGLYNYADRTRLSASNGAASSEDHVRFGQIEIRALPGDVPNPISVNFDDKMALVGYDLDRRVVKPGETITLTLYWRGLRQMEHNYSISAQLVDEGQVKVAEDSNWPLRGDAPTALWKPGDLLADPKALSVRVDAPPGVYDVQVTVYRRRDGGLVYLPVISDRGEMLVNQVLLTKVQVGP